MFTQLFPTCVLYVALSVLVPSSAPHYRAIQAFIAAVPAALVGTARYRDTIKLRTLVCIGEDTKKHRVGMCRSGEHGTGVADFSDAWGARVGGWAKKEG